jgi:hypothetical protein
MEQFFAFIDQFAVLSPAGKEALGSILKKQVS